MITFSFFLYIKQQKGYNITCLSSFALLGVACPATWLLHTGTLRCWCCNNILCSSTYHTAEINMTIASQCAASLPLTRCLSPVLHRGAGLCSCRQWTAQLRAEIMNQTVYFTGVNDNNAHYPLSATKGRQYGQLIYQKPVEPKLKEMWHLQPLCPQ